MPEEARLKKVWEAEPKIWKVAAAAPPKERIRNRASWFWVLLTMISALPGVLMLKTPEIDAVPPTSSEVSVLLPALMPNLELEVISTFFEKEAPPLKVAWFWTFSVEIDAVVASKAWVN